MQKKTDPAKITVGSAHGERTRMEISSFFSGRIAKQGPFPPIHRGSVSLA